MAQTGIEPLLTKGGSAADSTRSVAKCLGIPDANGPVARRGETEFLLHL